MCVALNHFSSKKERTRNRARTKHREVLSTRKAISNSSNYWLVEFQPAPKSNLTPTEAEREREREPPEVRRG
jgi:hypothetical protein